VTVLKGKGPSLHIDPAIQKQLQNLQRAALLFERHQNLSKEQRMAIALEEGLISQIEAETYLQRQK